MRMNEEIKQIRESFACSLREEKKKTERAEEELKQTKEELNEMKERVQSLELQVKMLLHHFQQQSSNNPNN